MRPAGRHLCLVVTCGLLLLFVCQVISLVRRSGLSGGGGRSANGGTPGQPVLIAAARRAPFGSALGARRLPGEVL